MRVSGIRNTESKKQTAGTARARGPRYMLARFSLRARGLAEEPPSITWGDGGLAPAPATGRLLIDRPIARTRSAQTLAFPAPPKCFSRGCFTAILPLGCGPHGSSFSLEQKRPNNFEGPTDAQELSLALTMAISDNCHPASEHDRTDRRRNYAATLLARGYCREPFHHS